MDKLSKEKNNFISLDIFILSCGSDFRAYEILRLFKEKKITPKKIIVLNFHERSSSLTEDLEENYYKYKDYFDSNIIEIPCEIKDPISSLDFLLKEKFSDKDNIGIDISCLTKPYIYFLIRFMKERIKITDLKIFYTEPQSYLFSKGLFNTFKSNSGSLTTLEIPGYSGQEIRNSKRILIVLLGFDGGLSKEINEEVSPSETFVVNGFPSYTPKFKDISLISNEKLVNDHNVKITYAKSNNPFDTYNVLQKIKEEMKNDNLFINLAPLGTKPMALGACLFALHNPDVRVVYPFPEKYENKYTDKCWNSWEYILPLNN